MGISDRLRALFKPSKCDVHARFEILKEAISGTMSKFYKARDRDTDEIVGLKICDLEKTEFFENRFTGLEKPLEGDIARMFNHPRIVVTRESGTTTLGEHYLVMDYLDGPGLNAFIKQRSPILEGKRRTLLHNMAEALAVVHQAGFIHRDVCPRNFICEKDGNSLKLIDFGLTVPATKEFKQPGNRTGTPNYMAPEIVRRRATDERVDIFAFGVTAYQAITYELPWLSGETSGKAALDHDTIPPTSIFERYPGLHPKLGELVMQCMAVKPEARPATFPEVMRRLEEIDSDEA